MSETRFENDILSGEPAIGVIVIRKGREKSGKKWGSGEQNFCPRSWEFGKVDGW